jgi:hypothetical protein
MKNKYYINIEEMDGERFMSMSNTEIKETTEYDLLYRQSKLLFPEVEEWLIEMANIAYFKNGCKDEYTKIDPDEVKRVKESYSNETFIQTPLDVI